PPHRREPLAPARAPTMAPLPARCWPRARGPALHCPGPPPEAELAPAPSPGLPHAPPREAARSPPRRAAAARPPALWPWPTPPGATPADAPEHGQGDARATPPVSLAHTVPPLPPEALRPAASVWPGSRSPRPQPHRLAETLAPASPWPRGPAGEARGHAA